MIDTKALREKILDLAMRGKLVPQDSNDEPASELLKRIKEEKGQLIKDKKIRRDKNETEIFRGDDGIYYEKFQAGTVKEIEVPFELPEGWEWTNLKCLSENLTYGTSKKSHPTGKMPVLRMGNLQEGIVDWNKLVYTNDINDIEKYRLFPGDILFNRTNSPDLVGKTSIYDGKNQAIYAGYLIRIRLVSENIHSRFINYVMNTPFTKRHNLLVKSDSVSQSNINAEKLGNYLIPVPPTNEQIRIVQQIEKYYYFIDKIDFNQKGLNQLSNQLKQKVLDTAMQGKLVPQDPNDEPASVLLDKIRAEKQKLYEEGKLKKRDLQDSIIFKGDDNSYYKKTGEIISPIKLPAEVIGNWQWFEIKGIGKISTGTTPTKGNADFYGGEYPFFKPSDLSQGINLLEPSEWLSLIGYKRSRNVKENSILVNSIGNIGTIALTKVEGAFNQQINAIEPWKVIDPTFIYYLLQSSYVNKQMKESSSATTIAIMNKTKFSSILISIPNPEVQKKIKEYLLDLDGLIKRFS